MKKHAKLCIIVALASHSFMQALNKPSKEALENAWNAGYKAAMAQMASRPTTQSAAFNAGKIGKGVGKVFLAGVGTGAGAHYFLKEQPSLKIATKFQELKAKLDSAGEDLMNSAEVAAANALRSSEDEEFYRGRLNDFKDDVKPIFFHAAKKNDAKQIQRLLANNWIDVNARNEAYFPEAPTALMLAAQHGSVEAIKELVKFGADLSIIDEDGGTALIWAVCSGKINRKKKDATIAELVRLGADVNQRAGSAEWKNKGETALMFALRTNQFPAAEKLLQLGADVYTKDDEGRTALDLVPKYLHHDPESSVKFTNLLKRAQEKADKKALEGVSSSPTPKK